MAEDSELFKRAIAYCESTGIGLNMEQRLGYGTDGTVWESSANSAVKAVKRWKNYDVERESYRRLRDHGVTELAGFAIPSLIGFDDSLMVIEMDIVNPPYLIDFGKVYLDAPPPYWNDSQMRSNAYQEWRERFDDRWEDIARVLRMLTEYGIHYVDPRPSNINPGD